MTAIAGIAEDGKVWIGGDSAGASSYHETVRRDTKVFVTGEIAFGFTTSYRMGQIIRHHFSPPTPREKQSDMAYMVTEFIPALRSCLEGNGYGDTSGKDDDFGMMLVGRRGVLYEIHSDMQVAEPTHNYSACGCGYQLVIGSLYSTSKYDLSPEDRIRESLQAAEEFSYGVRRPFEIVSV